MMIAYNDFSIQPRMMFLSNMTRRDFLRALPLSGLALSNCKPGNQKVEAILIDELSDQSAITAGSTQGAFCARWGKV